MKSIIKKAKKIHEYGHLTMISFSGGRSSAMMTKLMIENYPPNSNIVCFANTGKEHEATLQYVKDFETFFKIPVVWVEYCPQDKFKIVDFETASRNGEPFAQLIEKRNYLPNAVTRFCTTELKIRPIKKFIQSLGFKNWDNAVGIRYDEKNRYARLAKNCKREPYETIAPLFGLKIDKKQVLDFWNKQEFDLNIPEYLGNCDMCFLKSRAKLKHIIKTEPERVDWWMAQESKIKKTFRKRMPLKIVKRLVETQPELFDNNIEIPCNCTVD